VRAHHRNTPLLLSIRVLLRLRNPLSVRKPVGTSFIENQENRLKINQTLNFENV
jgi:hypothetical protein